MYLKYVYKSNQCTDIEDFKNSIRECRSIIKSRERNNLSCKAGYRRLYSLQKGLSFYIAKKYFNLHRGVLNNENAYKLVFKSDNKQSIHLLSLCKKLMQQNIGRHKFGSVLHHITAVVIFHDECDFIKYMCLISSSIKE